MVIINWTTQALADLEAIGDFIARDTSSFAEVFVARVFQTVKRLENFPRKLGLNGASANCCKVCSMEKRNWGF